MIDAVRVSLAIAVRFIAGLEQREEVAFPNLRDLSLVDLSLCPKTGDRGYIAPTADAWADKIMQEAEEKGIDTSWKLGWQSVESKRLKLERSSIRPRQSLVSDFNPKRFALRSHLLSQNVGSSVLVVSDNCHTGEVSERTGSLRFHSQVQESSSSDPAG